MISFYSVSLPHCACGRAADVQILGTGNIRYDYCCKRCAPRRIRELDRTHNAPGRLPTTAVHLPPKQTEAP